MRGKHSGYIIPTIGVQDHPRGCGENRLSDKPSRLKPGSPPRMRGKPSTTSKTSLRSGITPADAGKTRRVYANDTHKRDHPRGCGENFVVSRSKRRAAGSPPRMRGKRANAQKIAQQFRITPADAGKTAELTGCSFPARDHPRGCGENCIRRIYPQPFSGSPPRMRGKLCAFPCSLRQGRITPADAGKTSCISSKTTSIWDHPRGCGENIRPYPVRGKHSGSPPRMRGKLIVYLTPAA